MKVYFLNSKGKEILIGEAEDNNEAYKIIKNFCRERSFKIPYMRCWKQPNSDNRTIYDVGSHTEFFIVES